MIVPQHIFCIVKLYHTVIANCKVILGQLLFFMSVVLGNKTLAPARGAIGQSSGGWGVRNHLACIVSRCLS